MGLMYFVVKSLAGYLVQVLGMGGFEFDDGQGISVFEYGGVGFTAVGLVFEFAYHIIIRVGFERISQYIHKNIAKESLLVFFFF